METRRGCVVRRKEAMKKLNGYLVGHGHFGDDFNLAAVRFQKPLLFVHEPLEFVEETTTNILVSVELVASVSNAIFPAENWKQRRVRHKHERTLLYAVLDGAGQRSVGGLAGGGGGGGGRILTHCFDGRVLLALFAGSFPKNFSRIPRDRTFQNVMNVLRRCLSDEVELSTCVSLRHLRRNTRSANRYGKKNFWHSFYPLVCTAVRIDFVRLTGSEPSSYLALQIDRINKRHEKRISNEAAELPPDDFYVCEITFESDVLLGVGFRWVATPDDDRFVEEGRRNASEFDGVVEYVSPMIVSSFDRNFTDSCGQLVNAWLPLYRSPEWWRDRGGFSTFVRFFKMSRSQLKKIRFWFKSNERSSEKYAYIRNDLDVLFGMVL